MPRPSLDEIFNAAPNASGGKRPSLDEIFGREAVTPANPAYANKIIPQVTKGLYESMPFGKRLLSMLPNAAKIKENMTQTPQPQGILPTVGRMAGEAAPDLAMMAPFVEGATAAKALSKLALIPKMAIGVGAYEGTKKAVEGKPKEILPAAAGSAAGALALGYAGKGLYKAAKAAPEAIKAVKNITNRFFRGGLTKADAIKIESEYGASNGSLVEQVKSKLEGLVTQASDKYKAAVTGFKGNTINSKEFYQAIQKGLRDKGWVDLQGNPTARYKSGLDPVVDKLTNMYLDMQNVPTNAGKKVMGQVISKEDFSTYRDALGSMLKEKPSDILVMQARNALHDSAEKSGMVGIKEARNLDRRAKAIKNRFLDNKGDLKIANEAKLNRVGTDKPLSQQEMEHIGDLEKYVKHPIIQDARKINQLNKAKDLHKKFKERAIWGGVGAVGGGAIARLLRH